MENRSSIAGSAAVLGMFRRSARMGNKRLCVWSVEENLSENAHTGDKSLDAKTVVGRVYVTMGRRRGSVRNVGAPGCVCTNAMQEIAGNAEAREYVSTIVCDVSAETAVARSIVNMAFKRRFVVLVGDQRFARTTATSINVRIALRLSTKLGALWRPQVPRNWQQHLQRPSTSKISSKSLLKISSKSLLSVEMEVTPHQRYQRYGNPQSNLLRARTGDRGLVVGSAEDQVVASISMTSATASFARALQCANMVARKCSARSVAGLRFVRMAA